MSDQAKTIRIHGNDYVPVDERIRLVVERDGGYDIVAVRQYELAQRCFYEAVIRVGEHQYIGTSEIRFGGRGIDATSAMENAETSAVGRALGFANIGNVGSVASADEVEQARRHGGDDAKGAAPRPATTAPAKAAAIGPERGAKLEGLVQKALIDQGASVAYAYDWLDGALRRLQKHHISDLTAVEGQALLERATRADVTQPPGGASGPSAMDVRPGPDGTWDSISPDEPDPEQGQTRACPNCGQPMIFKTGVKDGKEWKAWMCSAKCGAKPQWVNDRSAR